MIHSMMGLTHERAPEKLYPDKACIEKTDLSLFSSCRLQVFEANELPLNTTGFEHYKPALEALKELMTNAAHTPEVLQEYLESQLKDLITEALTNCPFYRERYPHLAGKIPESQPALDLLKELSPLSKRDLQTHSLQLWNDTCVEENLNFWTTSGSTGEPTKFIVDEFATLSREVSFWFTQHLLGNTGLKVAPGKTLMLRIASNEGSAAWYRRLPYFNDALLWKMSVLNHPSCDVSVPIAFLRQEQPLLIGGDPQAFLTLIEAWQTHYPDEPVYPYPVQGLTCGGDHLSDTARATIESFFGLPVTNTYAMSEVSIIASQCRHGAMHLHAPMNWVEVVDESGTPVPDGTMGELVVTNLMNWAFPLLRYRTGDLGCINQNPACPCGSTYPVIQTLEGRKRRQFLDASGRLFLPNPLIPLFSTFPVYQYQLIQHTPTTYSFRYIPKNPITPEAKEALQKHLSKLAGAFIQIRYEAFEHLQEPGKKFQEFISHCVPPRLMSHLLSSYL